MIATFNKQGNLPPGTHTATWDEFSKRFGFNYYRKKILHGMKDALDNLRLAGCKKVYLDGSFTTLKHRPGDFDGCWEPEGVDFDQLDSVLIDFSNGRRAQKGKYYGEFFISSATSSLEPCWIFSNKIRNLGILKESSVLIWRNFHDKK